MWGNGVKIVSHKGLLSLAALRNLPHDPVNNYPADLETGLLGNERHRVHWFHDKLTVSHSP